MTMLTDVVNLCKDWPLLERSVTKYAIATVIVPVLMTGFFNLPWILFCVSAWTLFFCSLALVRSVVSKVLQSIPHMSSVRPSARLLTEPHARMSILNDVPVPISAKLIPGRQGLPFIGETVSFIVASREFLLRKHREYGSIFATAIDFSGTFLVARRVVCLVNPLLGASSNNAIITNTNTYTTLSDLPHSTNYANIHPITPIYTNPNLKYVAYSGLFGSSSPVKMYIPDLANRILNNYSSLDRWEDIATPIIRTFLRRLVYEGSFSFADRVNELACELISSIFLNMSGLSVPLLTALDHYLSTSHHNSSFNASLKYRKQIAHYMHVAVLEEDRRFYARSWDSYDNIRNFRTNPNTSSSHPGGGNVYGAQQQYGTYHDDVSPDEAITSDNGMVLSELLEVCRETLQQGRTPKSTSEYAHSEATTGGTSAANIAHKRKHAKHHTTSSIHVNGTHKPTTPNVHYTSGSAESDQHDLFFIFLVEVLYRTLVSQLRTLVQQVVTNHETLPSKCRNNYTQYLSARQLVGNVSGTGLSRLSWGSTIYEEEEGMENIDLQSADSSESEDVGGGSQFNRKDHLSSTNISAPIYTNDTSTSTAMPSGTTHSESIAGSSSIGNYLISLSQMPWLLSPAPTPSRVDYVGTKSSVDTNSVKSGGVENEASVHAKQSSTHRSSGRGDYSFPISSSSSTNDASTSSSNSLRYSSSNRNHSCHPVHTKPDTTSAAAAAAAAAGTTAVLTTDAGIQYLDALQTPPADMYGRRMHSVINTSHTAITTLIHPVAELRPAALGAHSVAPSTPISRTSQPHSVSISNSSTTSNLSTTSIISSASKYTGRYGPRRTPGRTPGRAAYNVVTPARGAATPAATPSGARSVGKSVRDTECGAEKGLLEGSSRALPAPLVGNTVDTTCLHSSAGKKSTSLSGSVLGSGGYGHSNSAGKNKRKASKNSVRHRQKLIIKYITSVKRVVDEARLGTVPVPLPLQYSLHLCTQAYDVVLSDPINGTEGHTQLAAYTINRDDLVINIHPSPLTTSSSMLPTQTTNTTINNTTNIAHSPDSFYTATSNPAPSSSSSTITTNLTAHRDLGIFSELILSIFTHELTTGYTWEVPQTVPSTSVGVMDCSRVAHTGVTMHKRKRNGAGRVRSTTVHSDTTLPTMSHHSHHLLATTTDPTLFSKVSTILSPYTAPLSTLLSSYLPSSDANIGQSTTSNTSGIKSPHVGTNDGFCTVANHSVQVRKFRTSPENFAFLIGVDSGVGDYNGNMNGDDGSDGMYGIGSVEDDVRYYSDGL